MNSRQLNQVHSGAVRRRTTGSSYWIDLLFRLNPVDVQMFAYTSRVNIANSHQLTRLCTKPREQAFSSVPLQLVFTTYELIKTLEVCDNDRLILQHYEYGAYRPLCEVYFI